MAWKLLGKKTIFKHKLARISALQQWRMQLPRGGVADFIIKNQDDFVIVCALTKNWQAVTIRQFYINVQGTVNTMVAGFVDGKDAPLATAKRELMEEAGYAAKKWVNLGKCLKGKYTTGYAHYFLALESFKNGNQALEPAEDISVQTIPLKKFIKDVESGKFPDVHIELCARKAIRYLEKKKMI